MDVKKIKELFKTPQGEDVLKMLRSTYCDSSCIGSSTEMTYYNLGQKELIQDITNLVNNEENFNE